MGGSVGYILKIFMHVTVPQDLADAHTGPAPLCGAEGLQLQ